ncbi:hypothetical protein BKA93DRAFT_125358 [Sparassis latifolia]
MSVLLVFSSALYRLLDEAVHCPHLVSSGGVHVTDVTCHCSKHDNCLAVLLEETLMQCNSSERPRYFEQSVLNKICPGIMRVRLLPQSEFLFSP